MGIRRVRTNVILVDDQEMVRQGYAALLERHDELHLLAATGHSAGVRAQLNGHVPDVLVVEADLSCEDPFAVVRSLRVRWPSLRTVLLLSSPRDVLISRALIARLPGIVSKRDSYATLLEAVQSVARGKSYYSECVRARLEATEAASKRPVHPRVPRFTAREYDVLFCLAEGKSARQTAGQLGVSIYTVGNYKARLMLKAGVHNVVALTRYAIREGIIAP